MYANGKLAVDTNQYKDMLSYLLDLDRGPEFYGCASVTEESVDSLAEFLSSMSVVPTVDGGVQLEFHSNNFDIEIEFTPSGDICDISIAKYNFVVSDDAFKTMVRHRNKEEELEILSDPDGNFGSLDLWINNQN